MIAPAPSFLFFYNYAFFLINLRFFTGLISPMIAPAFGRGAFWNKTHELNVPVMGEMAFNKIDLVCLVHTHTHTHTHTRHTSGGVIIFFLFFVFRSFAPPLVTFTTRHTSGGVIIFLACHSRSAALKCSH